MSMDTDELLLIGIMVITVFYSLFLLIKGSKAKMIIKENTKIFVYVFYSILAIIVLIKNFNRLGIITAAVIILSGILYSIIPTGYDEKGIYIKGRFYSFKKMKEVEFDYVNSYYQLSFSYRGKFHLITCKEDQKDILKAALELYRNQRGSLYE